MKHFGKFLLSAIILPAAFAGAQSQQGPFKHIIFIVQENRTPDNLFGAAPAKNPCNSEDPFEPGVDIEGGGNVNVGGTDKLQCSISLPLNGWDQNLKQGKGAEVDPGHFYEDFQADYTTTLTNPPGPGYMDGFCHESNYSHPNCPPYSYVQKSDVQPYFDIAAAYGFANYMFQSNEGASMPAHQFLFTGTSAPVAPGNQYDQDFVADNVQGQPDPTGCQYTNSGNWGWPEWVQPNGVPEPDLRSSECYTHDSLVTDANDCTNPNNGTDYCNRAGAPTWAYYVDPHSDGGTSIWDAPAYIPEVCYGQITQWGTGNPCGPGPGGTYGPSTEWFDHVRIPRGPVPYYPTHTYSWAPILDDILACKLPAISWVIPDGSYSDHPITHNPSANSIAIGPSWVGDIIDAVGQSLSFTGGCDYWGYPQQPGITPEPTAIFVVWNDWGGWYDHVKPWIARQQNAHTGYTECDPPAWGCGYTEGFRVPLLVVSPYTQAGYVSGACDLTGCNNNNFPYQHDFGSLLRFTELNFGMLPINSTAPGYADSNAPDGANGNTPLLDFFPLWTPQGSNPRSFTYINTPDDYTCFQNHIKSQTCPFDSSWVPTDPDSY